MSNPIKLHESVTLEQSKEIMGISIGVEEAVLKLYKYISENVNDEKILDHVISLKTSISKFNLGLQGKMKQGSEEMIASQGEKGLLDTGRETGATGVLEAFEPEADKADVIQVHEPDAEPSEMKQEITEAEKNERVALKEKKNIVIDITKEWGLLEQKTTKKHVASLIERLNSQSEKVGEILGEGARNQFESKVEDFKYQVSNIKSLNEAMNSLFDWADENKVRIVAKTK